MSTQVPRPPKTSPSALFASAPVDTAPEQAIRMAKLVATSSARTPKTVRATYVGSVNVGLPATRASRTMLAEASRYGFDAYGKLAEVDRVKEAP